MRPIKVAAWIATVICTLCFIVGLVAASNIQTSYGSPATSPAYILGLFSAWALIPGVLWIIVAATKKNKKTDSTAENSPKLPNNYSQARNSNDPGDTQLDMDEARKRPKYLTVLCILSFIWIGLALLTGLFNLISGPSSAEQMKEMQVLMTNSANEMENIGADWVADMMSKGQVMAIEVNENFYLASFLTIAYLLLGLFGVLKMWKGEKKGFHLYITYCLLSVISMYLYVSPANIPTFSVVVNLMFSGLFILMYSRNLKWMQ